MASDPPFRSGYVAIIGRPNVGKSTLLNSILGEKVAIVTPRPQTTRNRIVGVKTLPHAQIIFLDTPGFHHPRERLGDYMLRTARESLREVDLILFMVEPRSPGEIEREIIGELAGVCRKQGAGSRPVLLLINKIDRIKKGKILPLIDEYAGLMGFDEIIPVSALMGDGIGELLETIIRYLPEGPQYYPPDIYTDQLERFLVSEIIREQVMLLTSDEIPYSVAVETVSWEEKDGLVIIGAEIYVEKESQKGIIIGKRGKMLKEIGTRSRREIESILNSRVFLELWVKVKENWRKRISALRELGYQ
jgi:GTP-binding protein Era